MEDADSETTFTPKRFVLKSIHGDQEPLSRPSFNFETAAQTSVQLCMHFWGGRGGGGGQGRGWSRGITSKVCFSLCFETWDSSSTIIGTV